MSGITGPGRAVFAAILLLISGVLNTIWGIAAISKSDFFQIHEHYLFGDLKTWGWITLVLGVVELVAGVSLLGSGNFGRWVGIAVGSVVAVEALLTIPAYPFWSLAVFALSLWIVYGLTRPEPESSAPPTISPSSELIPEYRARPPAG
jgi:hypothetical protein